MHSASECNPTWCPPFPSFLPTSAPARTDRDALASSLRCGVVVVGYPLPPEPGERVYRLAEQLDAAGRTAALSAVGVDVQRPRGGPGGQSRGDLC